MEHKFFSRLNEDQDNYFPKNVTVVRVSIASPITAQSKKRQKKGLKRSISRSTIETGSFWRKNNDLDYFYIYNEESSTSLVPYSAAWLQIDHHSSSMLDIHLKTILDWNFDIFTLNRLSKGRPIVALGCKLFELYNFEKDFHLNRTNLLNCLSRLEMGYHATNPYHCSIHAADVAQALHCFLQESQVNKVLDQLEKLACILATFGHDLYHPGVNQKFLENSQHFLCNLYQDSVLENFHWRCLISIIIESGLLESLTKDQWRRLVDMLKFLILATDMQKQQEYLDKFKVFTSKSSGRLAGIEQNDRITLMQILIKCADIANPCRPWALSCKWSLRATEEFFNQGDFEAKHKFPVLENFDRKLSTIPKVQSGFIDYIARPLFKCWHGFSHSKLSKVMIRNLESNYSEWKVQLAQMQKSASSGCKVKRRSNALSEFINKRRANSSAAFSRGGRRTSLYDEETRRVTLPMVSCGESSSTLWSAMYRSSESSQSPQVAYQALSIDQQSSSAAPVEERPSSSTCIRLSLIPIPDSPESEEEEEADDDIDEDAEQFSRYKALLESCLGKGRRASEPIVHYSWNGANKKNNNNNGGGGNHIASAQQATITNPPCRRGSLPMTEKELQVLHLGVDNRSRHSTSPNDKHRSFIFCTPVGV